MWSPARRTVTNAAWIAAMPVAKTNAACGALDLCDRVGERLRRRVVDARVRVTRLAVAQDVGQLRRGRGAESHGLVDRHGVRMLLDVRRSGRSGQGARAEPGGRPRGFRSRTDATWQACTGRAADVPLARLPRRRTRRRWRNGWPYRRVRRRPLGRGLDGHLLSGLGRSIGGGDDGHHRHDGRRRRLDRRQRSDGRRRLYRRQRADGRRRLNGRRRCRDGDRFGHRRRLRKRRRRGDGGRRRDGRWTGRWW